MTGIFQGTACQRNPCPEPLYESQYPHGFRQVGIAVVRHAASTQVFGRDRPIDASGARHLDPITEPYDFHWRMGFLVRAVHDGIADNLLQSRQGLLVGSLFNGSRSEFHCRAIVRPEFVLQPTNHLRDGAPHLLGINYIVRHVGACDAKKQDIRSR